MSSSLKILHLFNEINFSGAELMYAAAAPLFQAEGVELLAFSTGEKRGDFAAEFERKKIKVYHRPIKPGGNAFRYYYEFYKFLKSEKIDVLHIHRANLYAAAFCSRMAGVRTIKTMHSVFKNRKHTYPYGWLQRFFARKISNVVFQTISKSVYENELNYYHNPSVQINNWYDDDKFFPPKDAFEKKKLREELGIEQSCFVIISVGACSAIKNHTDIIRALALIGREINVLYLHAGRGKSEADEIKLAEELGVKNKIRFLGNLWNVRNFLIASDVYVMPSTVEGLSNSCLEAMACGLPSILYNSPGLRDLISNDDNGFLIEKTPKSLAQKILLFMQNPELVKEKGFHACSYVNANYSVRKNILKMMALYEKASFFEKGL